MDNYDQIWAIDDRYLPLVAEGSGFDVKALARGRSAPPASQTVRGNRNVAVIPIHGVLSQRPTLLGQMFGQSNTQALTAQITAAAHDPDISGIVLDIDSPGGSISGIQELWDTVFGMRSRKPITASANSIADSAAYWIASAATEITVTPSGQVGGIGLILIHRDISVAMEKQGIKTSLISAGSNKTAGNPFEPLSDGARAGLQSRLDTFYRMFTGAVAKGRGVNLFDVRTGFGQGDGVLAQEAKRLGMVDRVEAFEATLARLTGSTTTALPTAKGAVVLSADATEWAIPTAKNAGATASQPSHRTASGEFCYRAAAPGEADAALVAVGGRATIEASRRLHLSPIPRFQAVVRTAVGDPNAVLTSGKEVLGFTFPTKSVVYAVFDETTDRRGVIMTVGHECHHRHEGTVREHSEVLCEAFAVGFYRSFDG